MPRFVVVDRGDPVVPVAGALLAYSRPVVTGWGGHGGEVCRGVVRDPRGASDAVLAAVRGADLLVRLEATEDVAVRLCDDLRRLGRLTYVPAADLPGLPTVGADEVALLRLLLDGCSLGAAARRLHVSRRTADRWLAAARQALGAATTAEALRRATDAGIAS